jgi:PAS domain S-box-containing protein
MTDQVRELHHFAGGSYLQQATFADRHHPDTISPVLDALPGLVFAKDADGRFTMANTATAARFGTTVGQLIGKHESDFNPRTDDVARAHQAEQHVLKSGVPSHPVEEALLDPRTGSTRWFEIRRSALAREGSAGREVLVTAVDITDRKATESAIRDSERHSRQSQKMEAIAQLAGGVAHDFNNLFTAIQGYTALLLESASDRPDLMADLEEIRKASERAGVLTRELLTFSKKQPSHTSKINLNDIVSQHEKMLRRLSGEGIQVEVITEPELGLVNADPNQIEQILVNLTVNARDAMPEGGVLRVETRNGVMPVDPKAVSTEAPRACALMIVSDTGIGIPPELLDRVFEPFFTTKGPGKGTGLGLSTVYGIVAQSGGTMTVESAPGKGSKFIVRLPVLARAGTGAAASTPAQSPHAGTETILLVEDEPGVRHLVQRVLTKKGYDVLEAHDVAHAASIATTHEGPIHLLLSDIVMPGLSGPDLAQRIVAQRPDVRVLYMSGCANRSSAELSAICPGVGILQKPFSPEHLARTVRDCIDGS